MKLMLCLFVSQALLRNVYGDPIQLSSSTAVLDVEGMSTGAAVISIVHWLLLLKDHHQAMVIEDASSTPDVKIIGLPESAESFGLRVRISSCMISIFKFLVQNHNSSGSAILELE